jgi:hypothetical protein
MGVNLLMDDKLITKFSRRHKISKTAKIGWRF